MSFLSRLISLFRENPEPEMPAPLPAGKMRLHLLTANFETREKARHYCLYSRGDRPERLTLEQPNAFIDTTFVEVTFGGAQERLDEFLDPKIVKKIVKKMRGENTLIILTEDAFGGFPYRLIDNDTVRVIGSYIVDV